MRGSDRGGQEISSLAGYPGWGAMQFLLSACKIYKFYGCG